MKFVYMLVSILVFVVLLNTGSAFAEEPLVGSNPCTYGPSYWCANADNAKKCGLTAEHCAERYGGFKDQ